MRSARLLSDLAKAHPEFAKLQSVGKTYAGREMWMLTVTNFAKGDAEKKPAVHATPLNHVGLWIDDLPQAVAWLTAQGVRFAPGGIRQGAAGFDICFLHPKASDQFPIAGEGVLIELVQAPPEVVNAFSALAAA